MPQGSQDIAVTDLLGRPPSWLLRSGISLIFIVVILGLVLAAFIRYPDRLTGTVKLQYEQPSVALSPPSNSPLEQLFVADGDFIETGQPVALFQSDTDWQEASLVEEIIRNPNEPKELPKLRHLGTLQGPWSSWVEARISLRHFEQKNGLSDNIQALRQEQQHTHQLITILNKRIETSNRQLVLETNDFERQKSLATTGVISNKELEDREKNWLGAKNQQRSQEAELIQLKLRIDNLEQQIKAGKLNYENQLFLLQQALEKGYTQLIGSLQAWKTQYLLVAPIQGKVHVPSSIVKGQIVLPGTPVLTVIPPINEETHVLATICLSKNGSGKITLQDRILIRMDAYPEAEYGALTAYVNHISPLPEGHLQGEACNIISSVLSQPLITNYGKTLTPLPSMTGNATVITAERSLLGRVFEQFRNLLNLTQEG